MNSSSQDPTWWTSRGSDLAFGADQHFGGALPVETSSPQTSPLPDAWITGDESPSVNPEDLQLKQPPKPFSGNAAATTLPFHSASGGNPVEFNHSLSILDEFLTSQGGWRPPVPCAHCKTLRLQCFMLQTTRDNPNPIPSCSSCVALYRHCSLAGLIKRQASRFETPGPVIGHLHGVYEDDSVQLSHGEVAGDSVPGVQVLAKPSKRSSSRSNTGTRPLRIWFNAHLDSPYPSESEKDCLTHESGLSRTQVSNWFSNARRREKHCKQAISTAARQIHREGSPMPVSGIAQMTPFERWQNSPPEDDPANFTDIERAVGLSRSNGSADSLQKVPGLDQLAVDTPGSHTELGWLSLPASIDSSSNTTSSCTSQQSFGERSISSRLSLNGTGFETAPSKRRKRSDKQSFECTNCARTFTRKSDMLRHENAIHLQSKENWVCSDLVSPGESALVWKISSPVPNCAFCGHTSPDDKHFLSHEFVACADRCVSDRTFARKDHLRQHLYKFHKCRKWDGWNLDDRMERLRRVGDG